MRLCEPVHRAPVAIHASRGQMELKLNCTAQRMLGRCRLRLKTTTAQGAWVVRHLRSVCEKEANHHCRFCCGDRDWMVGEPIPSDQAIDFLLTAPSAMGQIYGGLQPRFLLRH